jgi:peptide/nickel transport system substrate-binding protein
MRNQKTLAIEPSLAESYRLVDDRTWEFKLRPNVKFHNGEVFDAEVVKWNIERLLNPDTAATGRGNNLLIDRVEAVDRLTARFITKEPFPLLPVRNTPGQTGTIPMLPPGEIKSKGDDAYGQRPIGTGPYKFVEWIKDDRVVIEANPDYWGPRPAIKQVIFRPIPETATRVSALLAGQADLVVGVPPDQIDKINASANAKIKETDFGGFMIIYKLSNISNWPGQNSKAVRQALSHALDLETMVKTVLQGHARVIGWPLEPEGFGRNPNITWYGYDPSRAKQLLNEAGVGGGFDLTLHVPNGRYLNDKAMAEAIAQQLREVGVRATVQVWEQSVYTTKWRQRELLPAYMTAWGGAGVFDGDILVNAFGSASPLSIWNSPELDALLARGAQSVNPDVRKDAYFKAQELIYNDVPCLPVWQQNTIFGVANRLDWTPELDGQLFFNKAKLSG